MNKSVPAGARALLDLIASVEAPGGYNVIFANKQRQLPKPVTSMTVDEIIAGKSKVDPRSSATGRYQFLRKTLAGLKEDMKLNGSVVFSPDLQDLCGYQLIRRRGYYSFLTRRMSRTAFALALAQEWASLPVLADTKGAKGWVKRGQSYYAGDGLNHALLPPERIEAALDDAFELDRYKPSPTPAPEPAPAPAPVPIPPTPEMVSMEKLRTLNPEQAAALFRTILQVLGGIVATAGYFTDAQWATLSGPVLTLAVTVWGMWARSDKQLIISAASVPATDRVVVEPDLMASSATLTADPKVTTR